LAGTSDGHLQQQPILDIMLEILDETKAAAETKAAVEAKAAGGGNPAGD
jgi:hypothetical protein